MMRLNKHSAYADHFTGQEVGEGEEEASEHAAGEAQRELKDIGATTAHSIA